MAENAGQENQPKKKRKGLKRLGAAFAAAAVIGGSGWLGWLGHGQWDKSAPANDLPQDTSTVQEVDNSPAQAPAVVVEADVVNAFNRSASREAEWSDPQGSFWWDMLDRQALGERTPEYAQDYREYLSQFDVLRGLPLIEQVKRVNEIVNAQTRYVLDDNSYGTPEYWAAPIETVINRVGDCEDYAILEMDIMRYLGVAEDRLYLAAVNAEGDAGDAPNHAILLVNVAPEGAAQEFMVMSNMTPAVPDDNSIIGGLWFVPDDDNPYVGGVPAKFIFVNARNQDGYWEVNPGLSKPLVPNGPKLVGKGEKPAPKIG